MDPEMRRDYAFGTVLDRESAARLNGVAHKLRKTRIQVMPSSMCVRLLLEAIFAQCTEEELVALLDGKDGYSSVW